MKTMLLALVLAGAPYGAVDETEAEALRAADVAACVERYDYLTDGHASAAELVEAARRCAADPVYWPALDGEGAQ